QKGGALLLTTQNGQQTAITGVPAIAYGGQGGLGDVILDPDFGENRTIYLSFAESDATGERGGAVARAQLDLDAAALSSVEVIWRQRPKAAGSGHYGHRLAFDADGYLFITSGERQLMAPAQDRTNNLGAIVRILPDGQIPSDNPFFDEGGVAAEIWSYGHRNPLGLAFDANGVLWEHEMGPRGGDEFQRIEMGKNYGWPEASDGRHYDLENIPDHKDDDGFRAPDVSWVPSISPAGLIIYTGAQFPDWTGSALLGGLSSESLIRIRFDCDRQDQAACEAERFRMGNRIREIEQDRDGGIWILEDRRAPNAGRLLKLRP
ncbi:MAG: PQQ-dependent sugar dehydrogenase, partial [Myxococcota bacterium]